MRHLSIHTAKLSLSVVLLAGFGLSGFVSQVTTTVSAKGTADVTAAVVGTNVALASNGATATASSIYSEQYSARGTINGDRTGAGWGNDKAWNDGTLDSFPDWLQVDFAGTRTISEIDVFTLQDNYLSPVEPTEGMTFSKYGLTNFDVQYWTGSAWVTVPAGSITGNNKIWTKISFPAVATTKIRVVVNSALFSSSRITELEAWGDAAPPPPAATNVALASNGATATASSIYSEQYSARGTINGDRTGAGWGGDKAWNDGTLDSFPDWLQVDFAGTKTISEIDVFTLQDNYLSPVEPTEGMTFSKYGLTNFDVQYWTGSAWVTVPAGSITGNNKVWTKISFPAIATTKIRVLVNSALYSYSRITELEAWGVTD